MAIRSIDPAKVRHCDKCKMPVAWAMSSKSRWYLVDAIMSKGTSTATFAEYDTARPHRLSCKGNQEG